MKVLVCSLFQFPNGHLKVAEAIQESISKEYVNAEIKIVDFLGYCNWNLEKFVSALYLTCINKSPSVYRSLYKNIMYSEDSSKLQMQFPFISLYFEQKMKQLISKEEPTLIVCSHSFPSKMIGKLKEKGIISDVPAVNVYTDFFINDIWAKHPIQYHLVPHNKAKETLITKHGIKEENVFVTGIPISDSFNQTISKKDKRTKHVLVAGGNNGLFKSSELVKMLESNPEITFTVLCGKNRELYDRLSSLNLPHIQPRGYIDSSAELNDLYGEVDAILTKPGGVTISEALQKKVPIIIHNSLPGQEEVNLKFLQEQGIVRASSSNQLIEEVNSLVFNDDERTAMKLKMERYLEEISYNYTDAISYIIQKEVSQDLVRSTS
ncbi:hypothetical protein D0469_10385 [Peribacillus saganii]|uniref:Diacylglycerol glucosyltransferase N-terminal domain-containing protein n=1 Tax=Peribacillus saganii TaxID=2303992 RepID=A0A372LNG4_9BACI|nr:hypothetical protein [Peribacillus saganii]RFU69151.1 hypothetical protein D0469_10385 [Peribacillus saganii]